MSVVSSVSEIVARLRDTADVLDEMDELPPLSITVGIMVLRTEVPGEEQRVAIVDRIAAALGEETKQGPASDIYGSRSVYTLAPKRRARRTLDES